MIKDQKIQMLVIVAVTAVVSFFLATLFMQTIIAQKESKKIEAMRSNKLLPGCYKRKKEKYRETEIVVFDFDGEYNYEVYYNLYGQFERTIITSTPHKMYHPENFKRVTCPSLEIHQEAEKDLKNHNALDKILEAISLGSN